MESYLFRDTASTVLILELDVAIWHIIHEHAFKVFSVLQSEFSLSLAIALEEVALIYLTIGLPVRTIAVRLAIGELTLNDTSIGVSESSLTLAFSVLHTTFIDFSIWPYELSNTVGKVVLEFAFIDHSIAHLKFSLAAADVILEATLILITIFGLLIALSIENTLLEEALNDVPLLIFELTKTCFLTEQEHSLVSGSILLNFFAVAPWQAVLEHAIDCGSICRFDVSLSVALA